MKIKRIWLSFIGTISLTFSLWAHPIKPPRILGLASWYGKKHQGRKMANGQKFDRHQLTAASWLFPLGTKIRVVNIINGRSVLVTITDRGPSHRLQRIIDLSEAAAEQLGYTHQGVTPVLIIPTVNLEPSPAISDEHLQEPVE
jgi:rare lipoprotein A